jgi:hypothetical protein
MTIPLVWGRCPSLCSAGVLAPGAKLRGVTKREKWPAPYMPLVAAVLIVGNLIRGEVRLAVIIAVFSIIVITVGTLIGNAVVAHRD